MKKAVFVKIMTIPLDISQENVKSLIDEVPGLKLVFEKMELVESWNAMQRKEHVFMSDLEATLYRMTEEELLKISTNTVPMLWVMFFLPTSSATVMLKSFKEIAPDLPNILLEEAQGLMEKSEQGEDVRHARVFIDRLNHLNSGAFVSNILSEQFSNALSKAIDSVNKEHGSVY